MSDIVVTVPKWFWLEWIAEGDAVGEAYTGETWCFTLPVKPDCMAGDRCYIVAHNRLRGYALITGVEWDTERGKWAVLRQGGAVAVTIPSKIKGFRGYRKCWWRREDEQPFPEWKTEGVEM